MVTFVVSGITVVITTSAPTNISSGSSNNVTVADGYATLTGTVCMPAGNTYQTSFIWGNTPNQRYWTQTAWSTSVTSSTGVCAAAQPVTITALSSSTTYYFSLVVQYTANIRRRHHRKLLTQQLNVHVEDADAESSVVGGTDADGIFLSSLGLPPPLPLFHHHRPNDRDRALVLTTVTSYGSIQSFSTSASSSAGLAIGLGVGNGVGIGVGVGVGVGLPLVIESRNNNNLASSASGMASSKDTADTTTTTTSNNNIDKKYAASLPASLSSPTHSPHLVPDAGAATDIDASSSHLPNTITISGVGKTRSVCQAPVFLLLVFLPLLLLTISTGSIWFQSF